MTPVLLTYSSASEKKLQRKKNTMMDKEKEQSVSNMIKDNKISSGKKVKNPEKKSKLNANESPASSFSFKADLMTQKRRP